MPVILSIQPVANQQTGQPFGVSGTVSVPINLNFADDSGSLQALPAGSTEPQIVETWAFIHPGYAVSGMHALALEDVTTGASGVVTIEVGEAPTQVMPVVSGVTVSVDLAWPAVPGTAPITYTVLFRVTGTQTFTTAGSTQNLSFVVTGLSPALSYDFAVFATNSVGTTQGTALDVVTAAT